LDERSSDQKDAARANCSYGVHAYPATEDVSMSLTTADVAAIDVAAIDELANMMVQRVVRLELVVNRVIEKLQELESLVDLQTEAHTLH
jgi:hypothetical protein